MIEIRRVAVLGAGAMGSYFASRFFEEEGFETHFIARGSRKDRLNRDGLVVNGTLQRIPAIDPDEMSQPADLIIVALKHHYLPEAAPDLQYLISDETTIISVMNGLESEEYLGSIYGLEKMLYAVSVGIDALRQDNQVVYTSPGKHFFGEADNTVVSQKVKRVQEAFERAGIVYETPVDMMRMLWWKFMVNVGMNQASAVMRAPYGVFQTSPEARSLMESLMQEVVELAQASDVNLKNQDINDWYPVLDTLSPTGRTSMLQDIEAGRKTEVEMFGGKVVELGKILDIPTPFNQALVQIIQVLEQYPG
jgi:2-dehydropantoate 2-reductase